MRAALSKQRKEVEQHQKEVAALNALQRGLASDIASTRRQLSGINADLSAVRKKIDKMSDRIDVVKGKYQDLVDELAKLDRQLLFLESRETVKREDLRERRAQLAERLRSAYDTDRTSLLESLLSGQTFADMLTQVGYYLDVGEQDKALAEQISQDEETLAALHQTVDATRSETNDMRLQTAAQKRELDARMADLRAARAQLRRLEKETAKNLAIQKAMYAKVQANRKNAKRGPRGRRGRAEAPGAQDLRDRRARVPAGQHPVAVQRDAPLADVGERDPELRVHRVLVGAAARRLRALPPGHRHRRPAGHEGPRVR